MMNLTDSQIRDLGFMFQKLWKLWKADDHALNGFTMVLDALGIPWCLVPDKKDSDRFSAVEIANKTFKL
jgi:hypothetical protein